MYTSCSLFRIKIKYFSKLNLPHMAMKGKTGQVATLHNSFFKVFQLDIDYNINMVNRMIQMNKIYDNDKHFFHLI